VGHGALKCCGQTSGRVEDLQKQLQDLFTAQNKSQRKDMTSIPATYLRVTVTP